MASTKLYLYLLYCLFHCLSVVCETTLYDERDFVIQLNASNFETSLANSNHSWIFEFYNRWCGHCVAFAPTWKALAYDTQAWRKVISVGALDCAEDHNLPLCRKQAVYAFPTIKFFKPGATESNYPLPRDQRTEQLLSEAMVNFLETTVASVDFSAIKTTNIPGLFEGLPNSIKNVVVIAERNDSYLGKQVMLDFNEDQSVKILRTLNDNIPLLQALNITSFPSAVVIGRDLTVKYYKEPLSTSDKSKSSEMSHTVLAKFIAGTLHPQNSAPVIDAEEGAGHKPQENEETKAEAEYSDIRSTDEVFMADLENSISYSIRHEVALHKTISGEKLDALKDFVAMLVQNFPGRLPVVNFLTKFESWLQSLTTVAVDDYIRFINDSQSADTFLPPQQPWMGCKGSVEGLRGYPCSMWVLFHTMTVAAYSSQGKASDFDPVKPVSSFANYIKHFFSCEECSLHFQEMTGNLAAEIINPEDAVLWPWNAHNKVNTRLHGEPSEDLQHLKIQFPPQNLCPNCRPDENSEWNKSLVLRFLQLWYSRPAINMTGVAPIPSSHGRPRPTSSAAAVSNVQFPLNQEEVEEVEPVQARFLEARLDVQEPEPLHHASNQHRLLRSSWGFSALDMSLCLVLYLCSAAILLVVYFVVIVKRKLRKKAYQQISFAFV